MCGICGLVSASGSVDPERVARMSATLVHRGPDSFGDHIDHAVADDHVAGREDLSRRLWGLLAFTLWHERHVERTPMTPSTLLQSVGV